MQSDDYKITPSGRLGSRLTVSADDKALAEFGEMTEALEFIRERMEREQFWPTVYFISDHGNVTAIDLDGNHIDDCDDSDVETYDDGFVLCTDSAGYYEIDGPMGVDIVPADVAGDVCLAAFDPADGLQPVPAGLSDYCENRDCWTIERCNGWRAWLAMPGYMDRTSDCIGDSEREAVADVIEMFGNSDDSPMPEWEAEAREHFGIDD